MKKIFTIILALLYLVSSTGATLNTHRCMSMPVHCGQSHQQMKKCGKCGSMEKPPKNVDDCCRLDQHFIKNNSDQESNEQPVTIVHITVSALPSFLTIIPPVALSITKENPFNYPPSRNTPLALYIRNRVFRI